MASAVAWRLFMANLRRIVVLETAAPLAVRREVAFCEAIRAGAKTVEGVEAVKARGMDKQVKIIGYDAIFESVQAVKDGTMTQEQADWLLQGLEKGYTGKGMGGFDGGHRGGRGGMRGLGGQTPSLLPSRTAPGTTS